MAKEQVLAVLKQGMGTEIWGMRFYEQAVKRTASADGKKVFESLVVEESKHLDILCAQYAKVSGQKAVSVAEAQALAASVKPTDVFPEATSANQLIPAGATDEQALKMAMAFEQRGYDVYDQEVKQATAPEAKAMWSYLAKAEDAHYNWLQETLEYLTTNGTWYFDAQEFPNFET
jgi:rubrerythrin